MRYNVVCAGEALIDLVSGDYAASLAEVRAFNPHVGGSPANLANNLQRLGLRTGLICSIGADALGGRVLTSFRDSGLPTDLVQQSRRHPTTIVLVTKSKGSPDFEVYRGADHQLDYDPFAKALAKGADVFHTTCFALSGLPMRSHLLRAGAAFAKTGTTLSIDANYARKVWPNRAQAQDTLKQYLRHGALVKMSEVDYERLYGEPLAMADAESAAQPLLAEGARLVCFTFGGDGSVAVTEDGAVSYVPPPLDIVDATGAGDSFWSGFLAAHLDGKSPADCLLVASSVAAVKLQQQGPLKEPLDWRELVEA